MMNNEEAKELRDEQIVFGWKNIDEAAAYVFNTLHRELLNAVPVFLYKSEGRNTDLRSIVVVRNSCTNSFGVSIITDGWSVLYHNVPIEYLESDLYRDLTKWKIDKGVINIYELLINREKKNVKSTCD